VVKEEDPEEELGFEMDQPLWIRIPDTSKETFERRSKKVKISKGEKYTQS